MRGCDVNKLLIAVDFIAAAAFAFVVMGIIAARCDVNLDDNGILGGVATIIISFAYLIARGLN